MNPLQWLKEFFWYSLDRSLNLNMTVEERLEIVFFFRMRSLCDLLLFHLDQLPRGIFWSFAYILISFFCLNLDYRLKHSNLSQVMSVSLSEPLLSHCVFDLSLFFRASFSLPKASTWPVLAEGSVYRLNDSKFNFRSLMSSQTELSLALIDFEFGF